MYAITTGEDKHLYWSEVADPVIKDDEVLLEVHAAALNRADLLQRAGQYPPPPGWPDRFGLEAAGKIVAVGKDVEKEGRWHVGDEVCALLGSGGYAEYVAVPEGLLMPILMNISVTPPCASALTKFPHLPIICPIITAGQSISNILRIFIFLTSDTARAVSAPPITAP